MKSSGRVVAMFDGPTMVEPCVGAYVIPDGWGVGSLLKPSDWDAADFRLDTHCGGPIKDLAVNVRVTGRKGRFGHRVRVQVVFVGDGEPDSTVGGWMSGYRGLMI